MKYIYQATIIFGFTLLGELLHILLPLPVPAAIYGLVLLFVAPAVNIVEIWQETAPVLLPIGVVLAVSTVLVFAVSGLVTQWMLRRGGKCHE